MKRVISGRVYNTDTASVICELPCRAYRGDFEFHDTKLYRTKNGNYFLAGHGGPFSMWGENHGNSTFGGSGIRPLDVNNAREYAEHAELSPEEMVAAGFALEDA